MKEETSEIAQAAIFEAIENQIRDRDPVATKETYDRLVSEGHSHDQVMKLLGTVLSLEVFGALKHSETFNEIRYVTNLGNLPDLPSEE